MRRWRSRCPKLRREKVWRGITRTNTGRSFVIIFDREVISAVALHYFHYNFCRLHKTLRVTPAMAARVTDRVWDMNDLAAMIAAKEEAEAPKTRGPYKKKAA